MRSTIPPRVYAAIDGHLRSRGGRAHRDWVANAAHEDSLTGAVFADLRTRSSRRVYDQQAEWRWRITTRKFGSGGRSSEEKLSGADGIVEIEVRHHSTGQVETKGLLVQAKKGWSGRDNRLLGQVVDMESLAPGSSAAIDYSSRGYHCAEGRSVIAADGNRRRFEDGQVFPFGDFLAERFLSCEVGLRGLYYEAHRKLLHLPAAHGRPEALAYLIPERMRIEIEEINGA